MAVFRWTGFRAKEPVGVSRRSRLFPPPHHHHSAALRATLPGARRRAGSRDRAASSGVPAAAHMSSDAPSDAVIPESRTVTADVLGARFAFEVDPDRLNEAGVVWDVAVKACAEAMARMIRSAQRKSREASSARTSTDKHVPSGGDDAGPPSGPFVNVLELGAGTGALGIALASRERTRVFVTDLEPVVGLMKANAKRNAARLHATSCVNAGALPWSVEPGSVPYPSGAFGDDRRSTSRGEKNQEKRVTDLPGDSDDLWHFVAACETLYWGGWDVFAEDTRKPQLATMVEACALNAHRKPNVRSVLVVAFTVRDKKREVGFVLDQIGDWFSLALHDDDDFDDFDSSNYNSEKGCVASLERADARARAYIENAREGDLLVFRGRLKERRRVT